MHCTAWGWAGYTDSGVPSVSWNCAPWWPWMTYWGNMEREGSWALRIKYWITSKFKGQAEKEELSREREREREIERERKEQQRTETKIQRVMSEKPKEEKPSREEWSLRSDAAEKPSEMRSGHMVISGLGGLCESCFGGVIRPDWNELGEWVGGEEM